MEITFQISEWVAAVVILVLLLHWRSLPFMYHIRMAFALIDAKFFEPQIGLWEPVKLEYRVLLDDVDWNNHMNNSSYNKMCDFGRCYFMLRLGFSFRIPLLLPEPKLRVGGMNGGVHIRFKRGLQPFEKYTLSTRLLSFDEKWMYIEHTFIGGDGRIKAAAVSKLVNKLPCGRIMPPAECFSKLDYDSDTINKHGDNRHHFNPAEKGNRKVTNRDQDGKKEDYAGKSELPDLICKQISNIDSFLGKDN
eukprot:Nk52_evm11s1444 gene=Nk52_evmTU11s1444